MRGVADQREALGDERARHRQAERKGAARTGHRDLAELAGRSAVRARRGIPSSGSATMRSASRLLFGPHDRRALALQRQDRERPGRQEMLLGAAVMIALVRDGGDDAGLVVVPADASRCRPASRIAERAPSAATRRRADSARAVADSVDRRCDPAPVVETRHRSRREARRLPPSPCRPARRAAARSRSCARTARPARPRRRRSETSAAPRPAAWSR